MFVVGLLFAVLFLFIKTAKYQTRLISHGNHHFLRNVLNQPSVSLIYDGKDVGNEENLELIGIQRGIETVAGSTYDAYSANDAYGSKDAYDDVHTSSHGWNPSADFTAVVIVTYMRSGSSLAGDILQQSPGAFYVYEPLRNLGHMVNKPGINITYVNGTIRYWPFDFYYEAANIIRNWLVCDILKLTEKSLNDGFLSRGLKSKMYRKCVLQWYQLTKNRTSTMRKCAVELQNICQDSPVRVIKTIRMPLKYISYLLDEIPGLKIVHLVRDPRATLKSQGTFGMCSAARGGMYGCTNKFCTRLENDLIEVDSLSKKYPGRLKTVFYEDIASKPIETARKMFHFIGSNFTPKAEEYVFNITLAGNPNNCGICTTRTNSSEHIDSWKTSMRPESQRIIEERCHFVLRHYNYNLTQKEAGFIGVQFDFEDSDSEV